MGVSNDSAEKWTFTFQRMLTLMPSIPKKAGTDQKINACHYYITLSMLLHSRNFFICSTQRS